MGKTTTGRNLEQERETGRVEASVAGERFHKKKKDQRERRKRAYPNWSHLLSISPHCVMIKREGGGRIGIYPPSSRPGRRERKMD